MLIEIEQYVLHNKNDDLHDLNELYKELINEFCPDNDYSSKLLNIHIINFIMYDKFKYDPNNNEITKKLSELRQGQSKFREELINRDETCIITGDDAEICQACHIVPYKDCKSFDSDNGILLNSSYHTLFDKNKLKFLYQTKKDNKYDIYKVIFVDDILNNNRYKNYHQYHNKHIEISNKCKKYFDKINIKKL